MKNGMVILKKECNELWKTKKFLILISVAVVSAVLSPLIAYAIPDIINHMNVELKTKLPEPTVVEAYLQLFKNMSQIVLIAMIFLFATSIPEEKSKGTIKTLLMNHVSVKTFVLSKILAQIVVTTVIYIVSIACFLLGTYLLFKTVQVPHSVLSFLSLYGYFIFFLVIINLIGTLSQKPSTAIVLAISVCVILAMTSLIPIVGEYVPNYLLAAPSFLVKGIKNLTPLYWSFGITGLLTFIALIGSMQTKKFY